MIKSLKEAHNAQIHYLKSGNIDKAATMSELLSIMLAQEILNAFGGIRASDVCVIVAACKLAISAVEDSADKAGLTVKDVLGAADNLVTLANRHTTRLTIVNPMHKGAGNDD